METESMASLASMINSQRINELEEENNLLKELLNQSKKHLETISNDGNKSKTIILSIEKVRKVISEIPDFSIANAFTMFIQRSLVYDSVDNIVRFTRLLDPSLGEHITDSPYYNKRIIAIPKQLQGEYAEKLKQNLMDAGMIDDDWQPCNLSNTEAAILARYISEKTHINDVWKEFGLLWNMNPVTLRNYFNKALDQKKSLEFQERIKALSP